MKNWLWFLLPVVAVIVCLMIVWTLFLKSEYALLDTQRTELQRIAGAMAAVLGDDERFAQSLDSGKHDHYVAETLATQPVLDGRDSEWPEKTAEMLGLSHLIEINTAYSNETLTYSLRIGQHEDFLYLFYRVKDDFVVYRELNQLSAHRNDHVQLAFVGPNKLFRRYTLAVFQPGHVEAMEIGSNGRALRTDAAISGRWLATEHGYNVELQIPLARVSDRFSTLVADVDDPEKRQLKYLVGKSETSAAETLGYLQASPSALEILVSELPWYTRINDVSGKTLAVTDEAPGAGFILASADIVVAGKKAGELFLGQSPSPWHKLLDSTKVNLLLAFIVTCVIVIVVMIILRHALREQLLVTERESSRVNQYNEYLERMASRLNHELQTPISVIRSSIEHLQSQEAADSVYLERAAQGMQRLTSILNKMAEARRLEEALDEEEIIRFDLTEVVSGCVAGYELAYPATTFELSIEAQEIPVTGIPELIAQAFDKLIDNAVEFSGDQFIRVRLNIEEGQAILRVFNQGARLPDGSTDKLFESMVSVRQDSGQAASQTHLGLGLYVARTITDYHGGHLLLSNREDVTGVVATMRLPILRLTAKLS